MATKRATIPSPGAFVVALGCALCACRADPGSIVAAPDARVEAPDASAAPLA
jgi:hypothetical protein